MVGLNRQKQTSTYEATIPQLILPIKMKALVDIYLPDAHCIWIMLDNLNTHQPPALYGTFSPAEANDILKKLEFH
jgi:hypothetical protein